jgi:hypothetical protein
MKSFIIFLSIVGLLIIGISVSTLSQFPSISVDEVGISAIADNLQKTGRIYYPLHEHVVNPKFSDLTGKDDFGLRTPYFWLVSQWQNIFGIHLTEIRSLSLVMWIVCGSLLFGGVRRQWGQSTGFLVFGFYIVSWDFYVLSHLIRYDAVLILMMTALLSFPRNHYLYWILAGLIGPFSFLGVHPNGLLVWLTACLLFIFEFRNQDDRARVAVGFLTGMFVGVVLPLMWMDIESYSLARNAFSYQILVEKKVAWLNRILPWNWLPDTFFFFLRAKSFYLNTSNLWDSVWQMAASVTFFTYGFSTAWAFLFHRNNSNLVKNAWLFVCVVFALALGAAREEFIYRAMVSIVALPLVAVQLMDSPRPQNVNQWTAWGLMGALCVLFWGNPLFFLFFFLIATSASGARDTTVIYLGIGMVIVILLMFFRDAKFTAGLIKPGWIHAAALGPVVAIAVLQKHLKWTRESWGPIMRGSFLVSAIIITAGSTMAQAIYGARANSSLELSFQSLRRLTGAVNGRILGPSPLWFYAPDRFEDIGGTVMDFYYSGRKDPKACIERVRPHVLVIDDDFKRRFLIQRDRANNRWAILSLDRFFPWPYRYLGSVSATLHHSTWDVYELEGGVKAPSAS